MSNLFGNFTPLNVCENKKKYEVLNRFDALMIIFMGNCFCNVPIEIRGKSREDLDLVCEGGN